MTKEQIDALDITGVENRMAEIGKLLDSDVRAPSTGERILIDGDFHSYRSNARNRMLAHPAPSASSDLPSVAHNLYFHFTINDSLRRSSGSGRPVMRRASIHIHSGAVN